MARLIGTAGHVDHGKTTLIHALTGIDADRLPEEKRRGMTIDIGFAYVDLPGCGRVSIVDVPGHEKFVTNMLVGALGIDVALLCVAADEGVMPQTREHFAILELLPVQKMVVALTRADLADEETRQLAALDVEQLLKDTRFVGSPILPVSARTGEGLDDLRQTLADQLSHKVVDLDQPWYLPIDRVFSVKGHGTVVTGTLAAGIVRPGDHAELMPGGIGCRIRGVQWHDQDQDMSEKGRRTALNLAGVATEDIRRGMIAAAPGTCVETDCMDATVRWLIPVKHGLRIRLSIGSAEAIGRAFLSAQDPEVVQLRLESPVAVVKGQPLIIRRYSPPDLLGGGLVTVPQAVRRKRSDNLDIVSESDDRTAIVAIVDKAGTGISTEEIARRIGKTLQQLGDVFESLKREGKLIGFGGWWLTPDGLAKLEDRLKQALDDLHRREPSRAMQPRERAFQTAGLAWSGKPLDRLIAHLVQSGLIRADGTLVALAGFRVELKERQRALLDRVLGELTTHGIAVPSPRDLAAQLHVPIQAVEEILALGVQVGEIVRIDDTIWYPTVTLENLKQDVQTSFGSKSFSAAEVRDRWATTRKYVIPLLEHWDATGFTMRQGDLRVIR